MSIGANLYGYRNNFGCKTSTSRKGRTTKIKLFNLIIDGMMTSNKYDVDYFVSIAQFLMKKGYPNSIILKDRPDIELKTFYMKVLFSMCPFHWQDLMINRDKFNVFEWRKQFDLFNEVELKGLNFYRKRSGMPLPNFTSTGDVFREIFTNHDKYGNERNLLKFSFNSSWKDAIWILNKRCLITKDKFYYEIIYGCRDDWEEHQKGKSCSCWSISIESEENENYIDFCLRIHENYEAIISGSKDILKSKYHQDDDKLFYLGGNFKLRTI